MIDLQSAVAQGGEPILIGTLAAGAGVFFIWLAKTVMEVRDSTRDVVTAIFGNPNDKEPNGLKREVKRMTIRIEAHIDEQKFYNEGMSKALGETHKLVDLRMQPRPGGEE